MYSADMQQMKRSGQRRLATPRRKLLQSRLRRQRSRRRLKSSVWRRKSNESRRKPSGPHPQLGLHWVLLLSLRLQPRPQRPLLMGTEICTKSLLRLRGSRRTRLLLPGTPLSQHHRRPTLLLPPRPTRRKVSSQFSTSSSVAPSTTRLSRRLRARAQRRIQASLAVLVYVRLNQPLTRRMLPPKRPPLHGRLTWEMSSQQPWTSLQWSLISETIVPSRLIAIPISLPLAMTTKSFLGAALDLSAS